MSNYDSILVLDNIEYYQIPYEHEIKYEEERKSLQEDVEANFNHIFGDMVYIPEMPIEPPKGSKRIPDLYAIDIKEKILYVVEVELIKHSLQDHISPQIYGFYRILNNHSSRTSLAEKINNYLKEKKQDGYISDKDVLETLIGICHNYKVVVIIDEITDELIETFMNDYKPILLQFKKYRRKDADVFIYEMDTLERATANSGLGTTDNTYKNPTLFKRDDIRSLFPPGEQIYMPYKGKLYTATIESEGIRLEDGSIQKTPSAAAKKIRGTDTANGWTLWYQDIKCKKPIDLLRKHK